MSVGACAQFLTSYYVVRRCDFRDAISSGNAFCFTDLKYLSSFLESLSQANQYPIMMANSEAFDMSSDDVIDGADSVCCWELDDRDRGSNKDSKKAEGSRGYFDKGVVGRRGVKDSKEVLNVKVF
jgi:hypothetical protein